MACAVNLAYRGNPAIITINKQGGLSGANNKVTVRVNSP